MLKQNCNFIYLLIFLRSPHEIIHYARGRLGEKGYNLVVNNCQHFATECRNDVSKSHEVLFFNCINIF